MIKRHITKCSSPLCMKRPQSTPLSRGVVILEVIYQFVVIILVISQFTIFQNQFKEKSKFSFNNKKDDV